MFYLLNKKEILAFEFYLTDHLAFFTHYVVRDLLNNLLFAIYFSKSAW